MASYRELVGILEAVLRATRNGSLKPTGTLFRTAERLVAEARAGRNTEASWTPLKEAYASDEPINERSLSKIMEIGKVTREQALHLIAKARSGAIYVNDTYQVTAVQIGDNFVQMSIKRIDQTQIRSWRDLQRIKNEIIGAECEAIELYPSETRLVDSANQYYLFGSTDPAFRFPIGFKERLVTSELDAGEGQAPLGER